MNINQLTVDLDQADIVNNQSGDYTEAERLCLAVLSALDENSGTLTTDIHSLRARALRLLAQSNWRRWKMQEALPIAHSALEEASLGDGDESEQGLVLRDIGYIYHNLGDNILALEYLHRSVALLEKLGIEIELTRTENAIGIVHFFQGDYQPALEFWKSAVTRLERLNDTSPLILRIQTNIGNVYISLGDFAQGIEYYTSSLAGFKQRNMKSNVAMLLDLIGTVYGRLKEYTTAIEYLKQSLSIYEEIDDLRGQADTTNNLGMVYYSIGDYSQAIECFGRSLATQETLNNKFSIANSFTNLGDVYAAPDFEGYDFEKAEEFFLKGIALCEELGAKQILFEIHKSLATLYERELQTSKAFDHFKKFYAIEKELLSEGAKAQADKFTRERQAADRDKSLAIERALAKATHEILANILPPNITERLIAGEKKIADSYAEVSVLFVDIVGFTKLSSQLPAHELIDLLDIIFTRFDTICKHHGLEKIKTIGDAYMAVCGAPIAVENHAERTARAALEMLEDWELDQQFSTEIDLDFRIGLHIGSVVAGIIGENKYSYDLWGDAVNTASRMESHGEPGKIHCTDEFIRALSISSPSSPKSLQFAERGKMDIKGKGTMNTYFLEKV